MTILNQDFLASRIGEFDYIIGNPPYVPITGLSSAERASYRQRFNTATGRFDLYLLFFEQALRLLRQGGRLVFVTPEKFLYVHAAAPLRRALARLAVEEIELVDETTFEGLVTYPTITTVLNVRAFAETTVGLRDSSRRRVRLPADGSSWLPALNGEVGAEPGSTLADAALRISCGVATGADAVYVVNTSALPKNLERFAFPTVAGREVSFTDGMALSHSILVPYARSGELFREGELGELGAYLREPARQRRLLERTCVRQKPWYAFHENPPLRDILRPKILCKDITSRPFFLVENAGVVVPRHSVYYIVPNDPARIGDLCEYLNSSAAGRWLADRCQRAANGFLRLQSHVLKQLPLPAELASRPQLAIYRGEVASRS